MLVELAVVFLGVLIALAADAWRESLVEAGREREYLASLRADMRQAVSNIDEAETRLAQRIDEIDEVLSAVYSTEPIPDSLSGWRPTTVAVIVPTGTLDALVQGGTIDLIDDARLRSQILAHGAEINGWLGMSARQDALFQESHAEYLKLREVVRHENGLPRGAVPLAAFANRPDALGVYVSHQAHLVNRRGAMRRIRGAANALLEALGER